MLARTSHKEGLDVLFPGTERRRGGREEWWYIRECLGKCYHYFYELWSPTLIVTFPSIYPRYIFLRQAEISLLPSLYPKSFCTFILISVRDHPRDAFWRDNTCIVYTTYIVCQNLKFHAHELSPCYIKPLKLVEFVAKGLWVIKTLCFDLFFCLCNQRKFCWNILWKIHWSDESSSQSFGWIRDFSSINGKSRFPFTLCLGIKIVDFRDTIYAIQPTSQPMGSSFRPVSRIVAHRRRNFALIITISCFGATVGYSRLEYLRIRGSSAFLSEWRFGTDSRLLVYIILMYREYDQYYIRIWSEVFFLKN